MSLKESIINNMQNIIRKQIRIEQTVNVGKKNIIKAGLKDESMDIICS